VLQLCMCTCNFGAGLNEELTVLIGRILHMPACVNMYCNFILYN